MYHAHGDMKTQRAVWATFATLALIYLAGFLFGLGTLAAWHLLLVLVAITGLFAVFNSRAQRS
jgi:hypothetical protein